MTVRVTAAQPEKEDVKFQDRKGLIDVDPITCDSASRIPSGEGCSETQGT
jgi:hypothetical protein